MKQNLDVLSQAHSCYMALASFRRERERNKRYHYGDQWSDHVEMEGRQVTEGEFLRSQGSEPLKNNLIRRLVRNVIGVFMAQDYQPACTVRDTNEKKLGKTVDTLLKYNSDVNRLETLNMRTLEEFLISGMAVHRKWYGLRNGRTECWTDYVSPANFFFDANMRDFRAWDCALIGELHDISFPELCHQFAKSTADIRKLQQIYGEDQDKSPSKFISPTQPSVCRVIEVWRNEVRLNKGADDWGMDSVWRYYFLSPSGHVLAEGDSPYQHGSHPYILKAYPLIDGEIHSFVSDVIDQQRYTNRLITMYDWMVRASAKGVLLMPTACIPAGSDPREMARVWSKFNGVMVYASNNNNDVPQQVSNANSSSGISDLLNMQMKFFEDISGVNGALQGNLANNSMSGRLFNQQTQNATTALSDLLYTYSQFLLDGAYKDLYNMCQFFSTERIKAIAGKGATLQLDGIEYDLRIITAKTMQTEEEDESAD